MVIEPFNLSVQNVSAKANGRINLNTLGIDQMAVSSMDHNGVIEMSLLVLHFAPFPSTHIGLSFFECTLYIIAS